MAQRGSRKLEVTLPSPTEIRYRRGFDAPKHLVFEALTKPEHVRRWWCCMDGYTMPVCEIDLRVGGHWRYVMVGEDGGEVAFHGVYTKIDAPDRLDHTEIFEPFPDVESTITATFVERDGQTHYEALQVFPNQEARDGVIASGMEVGADIAYDRLEGIAQELAGAATTGATSRSPQVPARG
ncbi:MAG: SRPBCC family protein [Myxococcota bacterium]|nr:SRPBCC family protein [Myxococcota bacterium]